MNEWKSYLEDSKSRWEKNSAFWDDYMGDQSNSFHRELVKPHTERLLGVAKGDQVLDVACGNGNFSRRLVELGANVVAFDYSSSMIQRAKQRASDDSNSIRFEVLDAADYHSLVSLGEENFDRAVSNMALMDMAEVRPLFKALYRLLKPNGTFVFSIMHPCFQVPGHRKVHEEEEVGGEILSRNSIQISKYIQPETYEGVSIRNQPVASRNFHRPLSDLLSLCFESGFSADGIAEPVFKEDEGGRKFDWFDIPAVLIMRLRKC